MRELWESQICLKLFQSLDVAAAPEKPADRLGVDQSCGELSGAHSGHTVGTQ